MKRLTNHETNITIEMSGDTNLYMASAKQGDKATRFIVAKLTNEGKEYTIPEGAQVIVNIKKPDGKHIYNTCTFDGATVTIELTNQALAAAGTAYCDIEIRTEDSSQVITSASFTIEIEKSMRDESAILSSNEFTFLEKKVQGFEESEEERIMAETAREEAESSRATAETAREEAESSRETAETARAKAESSRETAETARAKAESSRETAETARAKAESSRETAETARAKAESSRATAETARETAETARAKAESERERKTSEALDGVVTASQTLQEQIKNAEKAGGTLESDIETARTILSGMETEAEDAAESAQSAAESAGAADRSATNAQNEADRAETAAQTVEDMAREAESYARGGTDTRVGEDTDNARFYADLAARTVEAATSGALIPMGTITFSKLPTEGMNPGQMYNISDDFESDERFEFPAIKYSRGSNVYYTAKGTWDVLAGVVVTGVKGEAENTFQRGDAIITRKGLGLENVPNVGTNDQTPNFTVATKRENIKTGEKLAVIFGKIAKWFADLKDVAFTGQYSDLDGTPESLKNPQPLTFTGGSTAVYDGSEMKMVEIPTIDSLGAVKKDGDTMTGPLKVRQGKVEGDIESGGVEVGDRVIITSNSEGGNICIVAPDRTKYEFDAYNGNLRLILVKIGPPKTLITPFDIEKITGITSFIGVKLSGQNENRVPYLNASKQLVSSAVTPQELDYLGGVKSNIQQQIDAITKDLGGVSFGITDDGRPGYKKDGADTVYPFNSIVDIFIFDGTRQNVENTIDLEAGAYKLYEFGAEGRASGSHMYIISPSFTVNSGAAEFLEIEKEKGEYSIDVSQKANVTFKWKATSKSGSEKIHVLSVITYNA